MGAVLAWAAAYLAAGAVSVPVLGVWRLQDEVMPRWRSLAVAVLGWPILWGSLAFFLAIGVLMSLDGDEK